MGFSTFWQLFLEGRLHEIATLGLLVGKFEIRPWLVIDFNNLVLSIVHGVGGHYYLMEKRFELFFNAIKNSGYRIQIFKDGNSNGERTVTKLGRNHRSMIETIKLDIPNGIASTNYVSLAFDMAYRIFVPSNNIIITKSDGEADPDIRAFVSALPEEERAGVVIMSGDASLIVGLKYSHVSLVNPKQCSIDSETGALRWKPATVDHFLRLLNDATETTFIGGEGRGEGEKDESDSRPEVIRPRLPLTFIHLPWIAALLESETGIDLGANDPKLLLMAAKDYMYTNIKKFDSKQNLFAAAMLMRLWISADEDSALYTPLNMSMSYVSSFTLLIKEVERASLSPSSEILFGLLPKVTPNATFRHKGTVVFLKLDKGFMKIAPDLGDGNERKMRDTDNVHVKKNALFHDADSYNLGDPVTYSLISPEGNQESLGLDVRLVFTALYMADQLSERLHFNCGTAQTKPNSFKLLANHWSRYEPSYECYDTCGAPLRCLVQQINMLKKCIDSHSTLYHENSAKQTLQGVSSINGITKETTMSTNAFNNWIIKFNIVEEINTQLIFYLIPTKVSVVDRNTTMTVTIPQLYQRLDIETLISQGGIILSQDKGVYHENEEESRLNAWNVKLSGRVGCSWRLQVDNEDIFFLGKAKPRAQDAFFNPKTRALAFDRLMGVEGSGGAAVVEEGGEKQEEKKEEDKIIDGLDGLKFDEKNKGEKKELKGEKNVKNDDEKEKDGDKNDDNSFGLKALFDVLDLRTSNGESVLQSIYNCWRVLGVSDDIITNQSGEMVLVVLYSFFSLLTDKNTSAVRDLKTRLNGTGKVDVFQLIVIEALLLSPLFATIVSHNQDIHSVIGNEARVCNEALKEYNQNVFALFGSLGGLVENRITCLLHKMVGELLRLQGVNFKFFRWFDMQGIYSVLRCSNSEDKVWNRIKLFGTSGITKKQTDVLQVTVAFIACELQGWIEHYVDDDDIDLCKLQLDSEKDILKLKSHQNNQNNNSSSINSSNNNSSSDVWRRNNNKDDSNKQQNNNKYPHSDVKKNDYKNSKNNKDDIDILRLKCETADPLPINHDDNVIWQNDRNNDRDNGGNVSHIGSSNSSLSRNSAHANGYHDNNNNSNANICNRQQYFKNNTNNNNRPRRVPIPCKYFARGNCQFGQNCYNLHNTNNTDNSYSGNNNNNGNNNSGNNNGNAT